MICSAGGQQMVYSSRRGGAVIETLDSLDLAYPKVDEGKLKELAAAKKKLLNK
jgi:hypothetical protein